MGSQYNLGLWGEQVSVDYLTSQGYSILGTRVKIGHIEVDIIALHSGFIAFIEVKTRSSSCVDIASAIDQKKMMRICRAANNFLKMHDIKAEPRIDIILVEGTPEVGLLSIEHYPDAFRPSAVTSSVNHRAR